MANEEKEMAPEQSDKSAGEKQLEALTAKVSELETSLAQMKDQLLRKAAEFENYKRRTENDYANIVRFANEELVASLLPVIDDLHRSLKMKEKLAESQQISVVHQPENLQRQNGNDDFLRGMELIYAKLLKILEDEGIKQFDSVGRPFDPAYHDALLQMPRADVPPHTIIEEVERGYTFHDKVIRHAKVIVSSEPHEDTAGNTGSAQASRENETEGSS